MKFLKEILKNKYLYLMALPGFIFLLIFAYLPISGHLIAFKNFNINKGILRSPWVGFKNFEFFFQGNDWIRITINTLYLNTLFIVFGIGLAVFIALCLNEIRHAYFKKISQSLIFLPYFISWMVVYMMVYAMLSKSEGLVNKVLAVLGKEGVAWFSTPGAWPFILVIIYVWRFSGYLSVIFLSALTGISDEYYESARMDGATRLQQILYITIPLIRKTIIIMVLLGIGRIFYGDFGMFYGIIGDNSTLYATTDVIDTYSYRSLRQLGNFSMASSVILYQSAMGLITIIAANTVVKRIDSEAKLF